MSKGGNAKVASLSCASAGNCAAGGFYTDRHGHHQGFVAAEKNGVWRTAIEVPGLGKLNKQNAEVSEVSCGSAGNCAVVGNYGDGHGHLQGFVASEKNGAWNMAIEVPGLGELNKGKAMVWSVSCDPAGTCAAAGSYWDRQGNQQGFVATERNSTWGTAIEVPGLDALNKGGYAATYSVSCSPEGTCTVGGVYSGRQAAEHGFVAAEKNGVWRTAIEVPGLDVLDMSGDAEVDFVSCASAGNCAASGNYRIHNNNGVFVVSQRNGRWGQAIKVPGLDSLNQGKDAFINSESCASAGNCTAVGSYADARTRHQGFTVVERDGVWAQAVEAPGLGALNTGKFAEFFSVSCTQAGTCAAGGDYQDHGQQGFVAIEKNGHWGQAIEVPGLGALNTGGAAEIFSVSCPPAGTCSAGGYYTDSHHRTQGFVVSQTG